MRNIVSLFIIVLLTLGLTACQKEKPQATPAEPVDYIEFLSEDESEQIAPEDAQKVLEAEDADFASEEYREAAYAYNKHTVAGYIQEAQRIQKKTDEVTEIFEGVYFRFLDGTPNFESTTVRKKLIKLGTWAPAEENEEWYLFTFYDRTLAQASVNLTKGGSDHSLNEYAEVLELLLSEPNVTVRTFLDQNLSD